MKKILVLVSALLFLSFLFYFSFDVNACEEECLEQEDLFSYTIEDVSNKMFSNKEISSIKYLYSLDESKDFVYIEYVSGGYSIYYKNTMELLEHSPNGAPYRNIEEKKYYCGPGEYFVKNKLFLKNVETDEEINYGSINVDETSRKVRDIFDSKASELNVKGNVDGFFQNISFNDLGEIYSNQTRDSIIYSNPYPEDFDYNDCTFIPNYRFFINQPMHGHNPQAACAAVASQLLLNYHNYYSDRRLIDNGYLFNGQNNPNYCTDPMTMTSYTLGSTGESFTEPLTNNYFAYIHDIIQDNASADSVESGIQTIISDRNDELGIGNSISYSIESDHGFLWLNSVSYSGAIAKIDDGIPILLLIRTNLGATVNHYVVGYGYSEYTYPNTTTTYSGYITHMGWDEPYPSHHNANKICAWVNSSWCVWYMALRINHSHDYYQVGTISGTSRIEYKCSTCGHRTDAAINISSYDRYTERVHFTGQNGYHYKDFYLKSQVSGNRLFQTFSDSDIKMTLFDLNYNTLEYDDDCGYESNPLFNYNISSSSTYILRVEYYNSSLTGDFKLAITPCNYIYDDFEDLFLIEEDTSFCSFSWDLSLISVRMIVFIPETSGTYRITATSNDETDTYLIFAYVESLNSYLYDDDSGGDYQGELDVSLTYNTTYFIVISPYLWSSGGNVGIRISKIA